MKRKSENNDKNCEEEQSLKKRKQRYKNRIQQKLEVNH